MEQRYITVETFRLTEEKRQFKQTGTEINSLTKTTQEKSEVQRRQVSF